MSKNDKVVLDPAECALILIDYPPEIFRGVHSGSSELIELNVCALARAAVAYKIPVILSTMGIGMSVNKPTIEELSDELPGVHEIVRSSINAWEDKNVFETVKATGRTHLIFGALRSDICLTYPVLEALVDGYEVDVVADIIGGDSVADRDKVMARLVQAGAVQNTTISVIADWFRDWKSPLPMMVNSLPAHFAKPSELSQIHPQ